MSDDPYVYPGTFILRNRLGITDRNALDRAERRLVVQRTRQRIPTGDFNLAHLKAIHRHLFQDVYDWAGEVRTVEIAKGGSDFMPCRFIENGMNDVHRRVVESGYFAGLSPVDFAAGAAAILGDVNHVHPFREGNGRTQLYYLKQLATRAGHEFDLRKLDPIAWIHASIVANRGDYGAMGVCIAEAISGRHGQEEGG